MMATLAMTIEGESVGAQKVLKAASQFLKLLEMAERDLTGKRPAIPWVVDILTSPQRATIKMSTIGDGDAERVAFATAGEALRRIGREMEGRR